MVNLDRPVSKVSKQLWLVVAKNKENRFANREDRNRTSCGSRDAK